MEFEKPKSITLIDIYVQFHFEGDPQKVEVNLQFPYNIYIELMQQQISALQVLDQMMNIVEEVSGKKIDSSIPLTFTPLPWNAMMEFRDGGKRNGS